METTLLQQTDRLFDTVSGMLHESVQLSTHPFHFMSLATIGLDGVPKSRTVVLRRFDPFHRQVIFHSDIRSPKIQEMRRAPFVSLLLYSQPDRLQIRFSGKAALHYKDDIAAARWEQTQTMSKLTYLSDYAPSTLFPNEELPLQRPAQLTNDDDRRGFNNFCVVLCHFYDMDITELRDEGNMRVRLSWDKRGNMHRERLIP